MATGNTTDNNVQAEGGKDEPPPPPPTPTVQALHGGNKVYKSGSLFLSSKGIGWTSWKKRWFILTQTSLVFYRSDPNVVPQKGGEANLTLGGIDLNSSGSVVVKDDKKLITVLLSDDRDGRSFTLKAETMEDLQEWKVALEEAISNAPNPAEVTGQNGVVKNDQSNAADVSSEQSKDKQIVNSMVIGGPILLALEDIDGTPSFLEKALRFLEEYGVKIEGILRQAADVDDVERRIQEYEKGKNEFLPEEDPHVIGDCIKYVLRELPSSPVPASCCKALLEAFRTERGMRVTAMRSAICETFPEPNRRLLQRILMMMQTVASHKAENRMSVPAVAACMAPLLLRPLLAGECEIENDFDVGGDGSVQLLQAAAAANHAQAIVIILLEEHDNIFGDGAATHEPYTDSEESGSESEEITDYEDEDEDEDGSFDDDGDDYTTEESVEVSDHESSPVSSEHGDTQHHKKGTESQSSGSESPKADDVAEANQNLSSNAPKTSSFQQESTQRTNDIPKPCSDDKKMQPNYSVELLRDDPAVKGMSLKPSELSYEASRSVRRSTVWGRTPGRKNLSMESLDILLENEAEIQKQECIKEDLETRASSKTNLLLQDTLERGNHELHERRLALEKDVAGLQEQLQKDMDLRAALEAGVDISQLPLYGSSLVDDKVKAELKEIAQVEADVINLKQKADDLESKLNQLREENSNIRHDSSGNQLQFNPSHQLTSKERQMDGGFPSASENLPRSKNETSSDKPGKDKDVKQDRPSSVNMPPLPQNQHTDATRNQKASGIPTSTVESGTKLASTSGKSSTKVAGSNSTTSGLSKLTNKLNFFKERRSQNATELPHSDKGSEIDNSQDSKGESVHQNPKGQSTHNPDKGGKSEGQPNLDRGKSESFSTADKNNTKTTPRTYSR